MHQPLRTLLFFHGLTVDARDAAPLARALPDWNVVGVTLPGHGAPPVDEWHPRAIAKTIAMPEGRVALVGHSWGAAIALWLATMHAVESLVLLEGGWFDRSDLPARPPPKDPHHAAAFHALFASRSSEAWPLLCVPTLAVAGTKTDGETRLRLLDRFAAAVPHARAEAFPHLGHDLLRDDPERISQLSADHVVASST